MSQRTTANKVEDMFLVILDSYNTLLLTMEHNLQVPNLRRSSKGMIHNIHSPHRDTLQPTD